MHTRVMMTCIMVQGVMLDLQNNRHHGRRVEGPPPPAFGSIFMPSVDPPRQVSPHEPLSHLLCSLWLLALVHLLTSSSWTCDMRRTIWTSALCCVSSCALRPTTVYRLPWAPQKSFRLHRSTAAASLKLSPLLSSLSSSPPAMSDSSNKYDVVVFGATSFAGQLVCEYFLANYGASPPTFKWAVAAR